MTFVQPFKAFVTVVREVDRLFHYKMDHVTGYAERGFVAIDWHDFDLVDHNGNLAEDTVWETGA